MEAAGTSGSRAWQRQQKVVVPEAAPDWFQRPRSQPVCSCQLVNELQAAERQAPRPAAPGMDVPGKRTCSEWPGGHRVRSGKRALQMHARTPPALNITLAAPRRGTGSRKASGALCPHSWLCWVTCVRCWGSGSPPPPPGKPPLRPPAPPTSPARLQAGQWTQQRAWGGARKCWRGGWGWGEDGRPLCGAGARRGNPVCGFTECWARSPAAGSQPSSL